MSKLMCHHCTQYEAAGVHIVSLDAVPPLRKIKKEKKKSFTWQNVALLVVLPFLYFRTTGRNAIRVANLQ